MPPFWGVSVTPSIDASFDGAWRQYRCSFPPAGKIDSYDVIIRAITRVCGKQTRRHRIPRSHHNLCPPRVVKVRRVCAKRRFGTSLIRIVLWLIVFAQSVRNGCEFRLRDIRGRAPDQAYACTPILSLSLCAWDVGSPKYIRNRAGYRRFLSNSRRLSLSVTQYREAVARKHL